MTCTEKKSTNNWRMFRWWQGRQWDGRSAWQREGNF